MPDPSPLSGYGAGNYSSGATGGVRNEYRGYINIRSCTSVTYKLPENT